MEKGIYLVSLILFWSFIFGLFEERSFRRGLFGGELFFSKKEKGLILCLRGEFGE